MSSCAKIPVSSYHADSGVIPIYEEGEWCKVNHEVFIIEASAMHENVWVSLEDDQPAIITGCRH